jgi:hypothetical protein
MLESLSNGRDKRRFPRVQPHPAKPVEVQLMGSNFLEVVPAADISEAGIGIQLHHGVEGYDFDHVIEMVVTIPGQRPFVVRGRVRSKSLRGMDHVLGVEFVRLGDADRRTVSRYVDRLLLVGRGC